MNLSNTYIEYTELGAEKVKVAPYILHYTLSKDAYANISVISSSGTVVRSFSVELSKKGDNKKIWDGRDNNGVRVLKGMYTFVIYAYDISNPVDESKKKYINISVDQLKIVDITIDSIRADKPNTTITFTPTETMRVDLKIYKPKTLLTNSTINPGEVIATPDSALVKTFNLFVEKGTTSQISWDGNNDRGDILVDGDYPFTITGKDSYGIVMAEPYLGVLAINRASSIEIRRQMFKKNSYAYPNPADYSRTRICNINYCLNAISDLNLYLYDVIGNLVWEKHLAGVDIGEGQIVWNLVNSNNRQVGRGLYIYVLEAEEKNSGQRLKTTNKIMVIK